MPKRINLDEIIEKEFGPKGSPERDKFEKSIEKTIKKSKKLKQKKLF